MPLHHIPPCDRPREKLLARGAAALSDVELLAIFLRTGVAGKTAIDLAREILQQFGGSLRDLLTAPAATFCQIRGIGQAKYAQLQASLEMSKRYLDEKMQFCKPLDNSEDTRLFLLTRLRDYQHEVFVGLFLDNQHRLIAYRELAHGTLDHAHIYPREVIKQALEYNAAAIIFAHNHPSGVAEPSPADKAMTVQLKLALELVNIRLLDHFILGGNKLVSFAERGLLRGEVPARL